MWNWNGSIYKHVLHTGDVANHITVVEVRSLRPDEIDNLENDGQDPERLGTGYNDYLVTVAFTNSLEKGYEFIISHDGLLTNTAAKRIVVEYIKAKVK